MRRCGAARAVFVGCATLALVMSAVTSVDAQAHLPACVDRPSAPHLLDRYDALAVPGARYRLRLRWDGRAWTPEPALRMPLHHASSITYGGFTFPDGHADLELEVEALERVLVRHDESHHTFFFEYRVRVIAACSTSP